jgi:hypothetical protein
MATIRVELIFLSEAKIPKSKKQAPAMGIKNNNIHA